ncbi:hypothetical protein RhiJN_25540 [Ceratobasidium sp. AG-Ba]|nr:hypothetical protein RhiJN_25540 [Ceratobasidium sp. AG-Ba]
MSMTKLELAARGIPADMLDLLNPEFHGLGVNWTWMPNFELAGASPSAVILSCEMGQGEIASVYVRDVWTGHMLYERSLSGFEDCGDNTCRVGPLSHIQTDLACILTSQTYIIGYNVCGSLRALRIAHSRVIELARSRNGTSVECDLEDTFRVCKAC